MKHEVDGVGMLGQPPVAPVEHPQTRSRRKKTKRDERILVASVTTRNSRGRARVIRCVGSACWKTRKRPSTDTTGECWEKTLRPRRDARLRSAETRGHGGREAREEAPRRTLASTGALIAKTCASGRGGTGVSALPRAN